MNENKSPRIKITKDGPYIVSGSVPLFELIIESKGEGYIYKEGRTFPLQEQYALCRCGETDNAPFCDGSHIESNFDGTETASREPYKKRALVLKGPTLTLTDDEDMCAFARFCHADEGNVWELTQKSDNPILRKLAIKTAEECPAGRLVAWDTITGEPFEPTYEPSIVIIQDPERHCSGPIWVRGGIQIEGADGYEYEVRNRVTLCRCGESYNKPLCDASHVSCRFRDGL